MLRVILSHPQNALASKINSSFLQHTTNLPANGFIGAEEMLVIEIEKEKKKQTKDPPSMFGFYYSINSLDG